MATLKTMYPAQANTPETTLAGALTTSGTSVTVLDGSVLPDAPNLLTIGADSSTAETVLMTAKSGNTLTIERGYDGTSPRAWTKGDIIGRYFTAADQTALQDNITAINEGKPDNVASPTSGNLVAFDGTTGAQKDSGKKPDDFATAEQGEKAESALQPVDSAISGDFASLDADGKLTDSGKKAADFATAEQGKKADSALQPVTSVTAGNLASLDIDGKLADSGKKAADFAAATHSHAGYAEIKIFSNVSVATSAWASSSTYAAYPYAAVISCSGVTADYVPEVTFGVDEATGGNFAPVALSGSGTVTIYAATKPTAAITLPSIKCERAVS